MGRQPNRLGELAEWDTSAVKDLLDQLDDFLRRRRVRCDLCDGRHGAVTEECQSADLRARS